MDFSHLQCQACGREFAGPGPLNHHARTCRQGKKRIRGALEKTSEVWAARKKSRIYASLGDLPPLHDAPNATPVVMPANLSVYSMAQIPSIRVAELSNDVVRPCSMH